MKKYESMKIFDWMGPAIWISSLPVVDVTSIGWVLVLMKIGAALPSSAANSGSLTPISPWTASPSATAISGSGAAFSVSSISAGDENM